jgi:hypothetical protein
VVQALSIVDTMTFAAPLERHARARSDFEIITR